ncbi:unnamed protein product, partial [Meganyctiphanes norvegica]
MSSDSLKMSGVVALVLARAGSLGIPCKNLALLKGQPLLQRSLNTLQEANCFDSIWVSTDDDKIASCAIQGGAHVHRRASYTATHEASSITAIQEFLQYHQEFTVVCLVQCTSPFLRVHYLHQGISMMHNGYDSVFAVTRRHSLRWSEG